MSEHSDMDFPPGTPIPTVVALLAQRVGHLAETLETRSRYDEARDRQLSDMQRSVDQMPQVVGRMIDDKLKNVTTKEAFEPVRNIAYGLVSVLLLAILGMVLSMVTGRVGMTP